MDVLYLSNGRIIMMQAHGLHMETFTYDVSTI